MPERGENSAQEQSKETMKKLFLNKWGVLLGVIVVTLGIKLGLDGEKTQKVKDEVESTLRLNEGDLPKDQEETQRGVEAIELLNRALQDAVARYEVAESPTVASSEAGEELKIVSTELIKETPQYVIEKVILEDGVEMWRKQDLSYPDEETATDGNYKAMQEYFKSDCPGWSVERDNQWEYKATLGNSGYKLWIRVEEDGSYTIGSLTGLEDQRNIGDLGDIAKVLRDKEEILKLNDQLRDEEITTQEFKKKLKEMGYLPAGME